MASDFGLRIGLEGEPDFKAALRDINQLVRKYTEVTELTEPILRDLIDTIVVHEPKGVKKSRTQRVVVNSRFIKDNWFREEDGSSE